MMLAWILPALAGAAVLPPFSDALLRDEALWGDGRAEYSLYDATEVRYGVARPAEVRHILVRESFAARAPVKADDWRAPGTRPVLKLNQILRIPTGSYRYDQMLSTFWDATGGELVKFSLASLDGCGNTYKEGRLADRTLAYEARTYWEGMDRVDRRVALPAGALFYDELPFKLRLLDWANVRTFTAPLTRSVITSQADALAFAPATFVVRETAAGRRVELTWAGGRDVLTFEKNPPHRLLAWDRADGGALRLRRSGRLDYWNHHAPGDERLLDALPAFPPTP